VSNNADVIPLDEQQIATDNEEDTADPQYFPGRRRSQELDPDQSDIEDQFLARVRPPSAHRSVYIDEGGAASSAPAEESTATSSKGAAAPSAPARSSHSKFPKGIVRLTPHHLQQVSGEDQIRQVPERGSEKIPLDLKQLILVSELHVHVNFHQHHNLQASA